MIFSIIVMFIGSSIGQTRSKNVEKLNNTFEDGNIHINNGFMNFRNEAKFPWNKENFILERS